MTKIKIFDIALRVHNTTKKDFSETTGIPYDTVLGWKRTGNIPDYAFMLLKKIAIDRKKPPISESKRARPVTNHKILKNIEVAFWGKNYDPQDVLNKARRGNKKYLKTILDNLWYKDAVQAIGPRNIVKNIEKIKEEMPKDAYDTYIDIARRNL